MAVEPWNAGDYRRGGARDDSKWKWVYDPITKQGRWQLAGQAESSRGPSAQTRRTKVTMKDLEEESRAIADDRARLLRKENTSRRKAREELRLMAEREEQERFRAALEDRKRELEEKRSLITAGPRVKPCELCFDNVEAAHAPSSNTMDDPIGNVSGRAQNGARRQPKPEWNSALVPSHPAARVGFQPASLIPPPPLPQRRGCTGFRPVSHVPSGDISEQGPTSLRRQQSAGGKPPLRKPSKMDEDIESALARAEAGMERALAAGTAGASRPATVDDSLEEMAARPPRLVTEPKGFHAHYSGYADEYVPPSNRSNASRAIAYFDNRAPISAPASDVGSVAGSSVAAGGVYRRKVDALKDEIEGLRREASSAASSRLASPATSVRSGVSTACSARSTHRNNDGTPYTAGKGMMMQRNGKAAPDRYSPKQAGPNRHSGMTRGGEGIAGGISRVREGLMRVKEQAALMDSLDLDSPAHRRVGNGGLPDLGTAGGHRAGSFLPHESLLESLDLSGSGPLSGMEKAQDWLSHAVQSALQDAPASMRTYAEGHLGRPLDGRTHQLSQHTRLQPQPPSARGFRPERSQQQKAGTATQQPPVAAQQRQVTSAQQQNSSKVPPQHSGGALRQQLSAAQHMQRQPVQARFNGVVGIVNGGRQAWGNDSCVCEVDEESLLLKSLARLDAKLLDAKKVDPAAAYMAACDFVERGWGGRRAEYDEPANMGAVIRAKPLDHWNKHEEICQKQVLGDDVEDEGVWGVNRGTGRGLRRVLQPPRAFARDRRIRATKNK